MNVKLSIIIPAYNAEDYLEDCVHSVTSGTYRNYEILLIDDGSTDRTGLICDSLQKECPQIRVFHTENRGVPSARNLGIENATGQFIGFVDADDLVALDMFTSLVRMMKQDIQLSMCAFQRCKREDASCICRDQLLPVAELDQRGAAEYILRGPGAPYVWNKLYRKDILLLHNIRFRPDGQGAEDQFFNAEYLNYCRKVAFCSRKMYFYITTEGSITNTFRQSRVVKGRYISMPRSWRYTAEVMRGISPELVVWSQSRAVMFYQTVLRKLESPDEAYIQEAVSYVKKYKRTLLCYSWGFRYYLSALMLCASYPLWAKIFRRSIKEEKEK